MTVEPSIRWSRRQVLAVLGSAGVAGCSFPGVGRAANLLLVRNHRPSSSTVVVTGTDVGTNEQVVHATRTIESGRAATVPDPTDVENSSGAGAVVEATTEDGVENAYQWSGGGTDVQQLRIHIRADSITFDIGPAELPESNSSD